MLPLTVNKICKICFVIPLFLITFSCSKYVSDTQFLPRPNPSITNPKIARISVSRSYDELHDNYILVKCNGIKVGTLRSSSSDLVWEMIPGKVILSGVQYKQVRGPDGPWGYSTSKVPAHYNDYSINIDAGSSYNFTVHAARDKVNNTIYFILNGISELSKDIIDKHKSSDVKIALLAVERVSNNSGKILPVNATTLLKDAIIKKLKSNKLLWVISDNSVIKLVTHFKITQYDETESFKDWFFGNKNASLTVELIIFRDNSDETHLKRKHNFEFDINDPEINWIVAIDSIADFFSGELASLYGQ